MQKLISRLRPMSWSGSRSAILQKNAALVDEFDARGNSTLAALIAAQQPILEREARENLSWETKHDRERDETFE
jgi:hypothetical protein